MPLIIHRQIDNHFLSKHQPTITIQWDMRNILTVTIESREPTLFFVAESESLACKIRNIVAD